MDSGIVHSRVHGYDENHPQNPGLQQVAHDGVEEHQHDHEKKSVLKKVKAKAKKIKDTITKHGHHDDHEDHHEDQHIPDDHDLDEEDTEEEAEPEIHGAPIYDSAVATGSVIGGEREAAHKEPRLVVVSPEAHQNRGSDPSRTFVGEGKVNLQRPMGLVEDPTPTHAFHTASNYQSKVTDPTGAGPAEIDITPVQKSFARMNVEDEPKPNMAPPPTPVDHTQYSSETNIQSPSVSEEQRHYESMEKPANQSKYTDKISSATSAIADKAVTAKNVVASKLGYGNEKPTTIATTNENQGMAGTATEYGKKIAGSVTEKLAPVYGTVAGVGSAVKSKVSGTSNGGGDSGVSMKGYWAEKLRPGDEDRALSEVITETIQKKTTKGVSGEGEEEEKTEHRRLGKVTESEEVKRRLGSSVEEENRRAQENSYEKGMVDMVKDVVGSWFGTTGENRVSQSQGGESGGERRLQESSN